MTEMVEILRQEHRNIESLLRVLERELSVFDRGERPDYDVVLAVIDYFEDYPESCHHPKEDMIFERLKTRDPVAAASIGDLKAEHQEGTKRLRRVVQAVERVLGDQDLLRENVTNIIRDFINHERQHMATEERVVFPAALNALRPEDWADIALQLADRYDTLPDVNPGAHRSDAAGPRGIYRTPAVPLDRTGFEERMDPRARHDVRRHFRKRGATPSRLCPNARVAGVIRRRNAIVRVVWANAVRRPAGVP
jgi:hemerythrin-like domain-containing protein